MFNTRFSIMRSLGSSTLKQPRHLYPSNNSGAVVTKLQGGRPSVGRRIARLFLLVVFPGFVMP